MSKIGLFAIAVLLAAPSYAADKISLNCVGVSTILLTGAKVPAQTSIQIDMENGIVVIGLDRSVPITKITEQGIAFDSDSDGFTTHGVVDRISGSAYLDVTPNDYSRKVSPWREELTCKPTKPLF